MFNVNHDMGPEDGAGSKRYKFSVVAILSSSFSMFINTLSSGIYDNVDSTKTTHVLSEISSRKRINKVRFLAETEMGHPLALQLIRSSNSPKDISLLSSPMISSGLSKIFARRRASFNIVRFFLVWESMSTNMKHNVNKNKVNIMSQGSRCF